MAERIGGARTEGRAERVRNAIVADRASVTVALGLARQDNAALLVVSLNQLDEAARAKGLERNALPDAERRKIERGLNAARGTIEKGLDQMAAAVNAARDKFAGAFQTFKGLVDQAFQGVVVVLIACAIVGAYLWGLDQIIRPFVDKVLL